MSSKPQPIPVDAVSTNFAQEEASHVHQVYDQIAPHFSSTRYKPWPVVESFLDNQLAGSIGADVGCGNGKYIGVNAKVFVSGSDRSQGLVGISYKRGFEVMVANNLALPYRDGWFDFALSIAVIHHLTAFERRVQALAEIARIVRPGGQILVFVWALEQRGKRVFDPHHQDFMVPWVIPKNTPNPPATATTAPVAATADAAQGEAGPAEPQVYHRYYHLFREHELESLVTDSFLNGMLGVVGRGYDKDNWYVILEKKSSVSCL
ncbi:tRNA methyltransferase, has a role in tRNA modification [Dimargaris verticillata]|uniref:tRNA methyltransferase, has a role in tRNA modification n=1 Tax=Dimargaris verticillata TaxID=2761393 RepID=A0A9W8BA45_9FUNG|nr:tRNA methyltransferase, has a role in tRNA modification [Dimargaris verticillata]